MKPGRAATPSVCLSFAVLVPLLLLAPAAPVFASSGKTIDPRFLTITDCPKEPGCPAIILADEVELNNESHRSRYSFHRMIKLFTQEGVDRYADVNTADQVGGFPVKNLTGRTVLPDGSVIPLKEEHIFVKYLRRGKQWDKVKSAKFPGVVPGAIIEYSYDVQTDAYNFITRVTWSIQQKIPVLSSSFILKPGEYSLGSKQAGSESVTVAIADPYKNERRFSATDVRSTPDEPFGPPEDALRSRVYFDLPELQNGWLGFLAGALSGEAGEFIQESPPVVAKTSELVQPADPPLEKVKKIYRFVQEKIGTEEQRAGQTGEAAVKEAENAGEVLARGYGNEWERTLLFLALVKQAGLEQVLLLIAGRNNTILNEEVPDAGQFDSFAAAVKTGTGWTFYDPAAKYCPFGMISAEKEGGARNAVMIAPMKGAGKEKKSTVQHLNLTRPEGFSYTAAGIPFSAAAKNVLKREAVVKLTPDGTAEVVASAEGTGLVDLDHRERFEPLDEEKRKTLLLEDLRRLMPGAELVSASFENITSFDKPATIYYELKLPGFATLAGDKIAVTPSIYGASFPNPFTAQTRSTNVHFQHRFRTQDRVSIGVPSGYEPEELPAAIVVRDPPFFLALSYSVEGESLILTRRLEIDAAILPVSDYSRLKEFYEKVKEADGKLVILKKGNPS